MPVTVKEKSINVSTTGEVRTYYETLFSTTWEKALSTIFSPLNPTLAYARFVYDSMQ